MKRRPRIWPNIRARAELLEGWLLVTSLRWESPAVQEARILLEVMQTEPLPLPDCECHLCNAVRGMVEGV